MDNRFTRDQHVKCFAHIIHLAANEAIKPVANTVNAVRHVLAAGIVLNIVVKKINWQIRTLVVSIRASTKRIDAYRRIVQGYEVFVIIE